MVPTFTPLFIVSPTQLAKIVPENSLTQVLVLVSHQDGEMSDLILGFRVLMLCVEAQLNVAANFCA